VTVFGKEISLNFTSEVENAVFAKRNLPRSWRLDSDRGQPAWGGAHILVELQNKVDREEHSSTIRPIFYISVLMNNENEEFLSSEMIRLIMHVM
jgi:hypothetical protein